MKEKAFHRDECWIKEEGISCKSSLNILAKFKLSSDFPGGFRMSKAQKEPSVFVSGYRKCFFLFWEALCT